eukprot:705784_1
MLGLGDTINRGDSANEMGNNLPEVDLGTNFTITQIASGGRHTCALSNHNTVKCWGENGYGMLGLGDTNNRGDSANEMGNNLPEVDLGTNFIIAHISAGYVHTCALSNHNTVKCWGYNAYGMLGLGDTNNRGDSANEMGNNLPEVDLGTNFIIAHISAGYVHTCALSNHNTVKCWGYNAYGMLGLGDTNNRGDSANEMGDKLPEVDLGTNFTITQIVSGFQHTCALSNHNTVKCWGYNSQGSLGLGDTNNRGDSANEMGDKLPEVDLGMNFTITQIVLGHAHTCALSNHNTLKCFGRNDYGMLGLGDTINRGDSANEMGNNLPEVDLGTN